VVDGFIEFPEYKLGDRIKEIREIRGFSQEEFAKRVDLSQATISQIERGDRDPSLSTLIGIAKGLDVHIAILFASRDVHVFDLPKLKSKYDNVEKLSPYLYTALGKVVQYAKDVGFIR
jgi:transcriptional regulator with XRE-family HTH domain